MSHRVCRERDQAGLYAAADTGELANIPGVSFPYEQPADADSVLPTDTMSVEECVDEVLEVLRKRGHLTGA